MVEALERHHAVRVSLHYSGCLIDWLQQNYPEFLKRLAVLVSQDQVEIMGGAYYEPILPIIPDTDKLGQIDKMATFINQKFGSRPTGMWLAERVWEPYLAKILAEADVQWTLVDDNAFKSVGLEDKDLFGYYLTEEQGFSVKVFPISKHLRYSIPWHDVDEVMEYLMKEASADDDKIAVLGDDGEKLGVWPGTYEHCWQKGWVDRFFSELEANHSWLHTVPLGEYTRKFSPVGRIYLPCASYDEMLEWSLPAHKSWEYASIKRQFEAEGRPDIARLMYGGLWRNFLVKYPEINRMHKKMLRVHEKVYQARTVDKGDCGIQDLWQAQCNCPYWHGVFGGIYLADIRATTYGHLIQAENQADNVTRRHRSGRVSNQSSDWLEWQEVDFDGDGNKELLVDSGASSVYLSPAEGGSIFEWDIRRCSYNVMSTLARRLEAYHRALTEPNQEKPSNEKGSIPSIHDLITIKDKDSLQYLIYDRYPRSSLIDHFFPTSVKLDEFVHQSHIELGDFVNKAYEFSVEQEGNAMRILLERSGTLRMNQESLPFEVRKNIRLVMGLGMMDINYQFKNVSGSSVKAVFGSEWNFNLLGGGHNEQAYYEASGLSLNDQHLDSQGELLNIGKMALGNRGLGIELELTTEPNIGLWRFPVESVSNSEGGIERIYQESCLVALLSLDLPPGNTAELNLVWRLKNI